MSVGAWEIAPYVAESRWLSGAEASVPYFSVVFWKAGVYKASFPSRSLGNEPYNLRKTS
jgi:hypothetical protein